MSGEERGMEKEKKLEQIINLLEKEKSSIQAARNFLAYGVGSNTQKILVKIADIVEDKR